MRPNAHIGQLATRYALGDAGHDSLGFYACWSQDEVDPKNTGQPDGLGMENVRPIVTRGILFDFVAQSSVPKVVLSSGHVMIADLYVITLADVEEVMCAASRRLAMSYRLLARAAWVLPGGGPAGRRDAVRVGARVSRPSGRNSTTSTITKP